jgi:hypothetical protein
MQKGISGRFRHEEVLLLGLSAIDAAETQEGEDTPWLRRARVDG